MFCEIVSYLFFFNIEKNSTKVNKDYTQVIKWITQNIYVTFSGSANSFGMNVRRKDIS